MLSFDFHITKRFFALRAFRFAFTMFVGAAFTDSADISATEAVNMRPLWASLTGYEDRSSGPEWHGNPRAQMAKMIFAV